MISKVTSTDSVLIRLTDEGWSHITEGHPELAGRREDVLDAIAHPDATYQGGADELLALKDQSDGKFLIIVYRPVPEPGFIITAFLTRRIASVIKRRRKWPE